VQRGGTGIHASGRHAALRVKCGAGPSRMGRRRAAPAALCHGGSAHQHGPYNDETIDTPHG
jgi:hypothetical protein